MKNDHRIHPHRISADVMRDLYSAGIDGITCYRVHGIRSDRPTFLYSTVHSKFIICRRH